jgi:hypothetical protein
LFEKRALKRKFCSNERGEKPEAGENSTTKGFIVISPNIVRMIK